MAVILSSPTGSVKMFDATRYDWGKNILTRRIGFGSIRSEAEQRVQLSILNHYAEKISLAEPMGQELLSLAGKLTPDQLEAVIYYVITRFKIAAEASAPVATPAVTPDLTLPPGPEPVPPVSGLPETQ